VDEPVQWPDVAGEVGGGQYVIARPAGGAGVDGRSTPGPPRQAAGAWPAAWCAGG